ncbi:hypothetical protein SAMN06297129_1684 [Pseudooceanicola antarcticus]|uniref:MetA-pathway of phenol degradation n=1 Tax=Pseudooceanicola antarcticus TaxID=1247613 RepID=A0A285IQ26_9RHOB|nr:hypothetical protein [Pseudooceanicola antarcticus]PJE31410.1 hypothetical protein CVM39_03385 [Pseudooceanicola antarcticus]SNY50098.1 hypothetical protein SAMN06297129_1684 [Pseudooceanicola antarcticus]
MRPIVALLAASAFAQPAFADDTRFEAIAIYSQTEDGTDFTMGSFRMKLADGPAETTSGNERNAPTGLRLRFDALRSRYDTGYDATPGQGVEDGYRLLLSYGIPVNDAFTVTVTGGVVYRSLEVRPVTATSPADSDDTGAFLSMEAEYAAAAGTFQGIAEYESIGANYVAATYLMNVGDNLRIGPTANYAFNDDFERRALGASAVFNLTDTFEIKATVAKARQDVTGGSSSEFSYGEVQLLVNF